jgi:rhomboid protease GluP
MSLMPKSLRMTYVLIAVNVVVFTAMIFAASAVPVLGFPSSVLLRFGSNFGPYTVVGHQYWRVVTAIFVHNGLLHIGLNMWALWAVGGMLEPMLGRRRFLANYMCAGCCGFLASLLWDAGAISCGASGAVFGCLGSLIGYSWARADSKKLSLRNVWIVIASIVYSVLLGFLTPGIDNANHIGGLLVGDLLGSVAASEDRKHKRAWLPAIAVIAIVAIAGAVFIVQRAPNFADEMQLAADKQEAMEYMKSKQPQRAVEAITKAIDIRPDSDLYLLRAEAFMALKNFSAASRDADVLLSRDKKNKAALVARATAQHSLGNDAQAIADFGRLIQLDPNKALAYNNRSWTYLAVGDYAAAMKDANVALEKDPKLGTAYDTRGTIFICLGQYREALSDLDRSIKIDEKQGAAYFHRAIALQALGYSEQSAKDQGTARALDYRPEEWETKRLPAGR